MKIFGVEKYANELSKHIKEREIEVNFQHSLCKVDVKNHLATFDLLNSNLEASGKTVNFEVFGKLRRYRGNRSIQHKKRDFLLTKNLIFGFK